MRRYAWFILVLAALALWGWSRHDAQPAGSAAPAASTTARAPVPAPAEPAAHARAPSAQPARAGWPAWLPPEALDTLRLVARGGPFPHRQDGAVFQNRERLLPAQPRGYYREYTVRTPGSRDRGARRIVTGGDPPAEFFYSNDHYRSFRRFAPAGDAR
ncbi:MAG TPA: ribonuclease domain-containing protein [Luteimonas sp.]|nr:ribonuclease domain-containing protein [Luteimonas sp.]